MRIVEVGTSFGLSTIYLAAAVRDNSLTTGGQGVVIGTENEPSKAEQARLNLADAGLAEWAEVREGDFRITLRDIREPIDLVLMDIWARSEEHTSELQSLMRISYAVFCLTKKTKDDTQKTNN